MMRVVYDRNNNLTVPEEAGSLKENAIAAEFLPPREKGVAESNDA